MSSKRRINREQRQAMCGAKRKFGSRIEGVRRLYQIGKKGAMRVYRCAFCGWWHLGHATRHAKTVDVLRTIQAAKHG